jgi:uncharacterized protein (TIGR02270 family)
MAIQVIHEVISQHAEEAAILWHLRDLAVHKPHYSLADLATLDGRVEAHLDGLRIAEDEGWSLCKEALPQGDGEVFAAAVLACEGAKADRLQTVFAVGTSQPKLARGLISALGWLPYSRIDPLLKQLLGPTAPAVRRIGIAAAALHRHNPGTVLETSLAGPDLPLKARACRAAGELGLTFLHPTLRKYLQSDDPACRFWSAWSATLLANDPNALGILIALAESASPYRERAVPLIVRRMDGPQAIMWVDKLAHVPSQRRLAILATGALGCIDRMNWLIDQMTSPPLARVAGEAFSLMAGVDLGAAHIDAKKPEGFESGPNDNPADENVDMDEDNDLPWPNVPAIRQWWAQHEESFRPMTRYLLGKPITVEWLGEVLRIGQQRQRAGAALELALRQPGKPLFEVRAPGFRQQQLLGVGSLPGPHVQP